MYSGEALENWGKEQIEILNTGQEKQHKHGDVAQPVINIEAVRKEWGLVKPLVVKCGYPRFKLSELWGLINCYHKDEFPNLLKLAALSVTAPIHTADCERGFSSQNKILLEKQNLF